jgi:hypothetical protein
MEADTQASPAQNANEPAERHMFFAEHQEQLAPRHDPQLLFTLQSAAADPIIKTATLSMVLK